MRVTVLIMLVVNSQAMFTVPGFGDLKRRECVNLYERYCKTMTADKCYRNYNRKLCCEACYWHSRRVGQGEECMFGDRHKACAGIDTTLCYNKKTQFVCCETCSKVNTKRPGCLFGDKNQKICTAIKPYHCYRRDIESLCCNTCYRHRKNIAGCKYGDRLSFFEVKKRKYNCVAYVGYFGNDRCKMPWDANFRKQCCESCHNVPLSNYYLYREYRNRNKLQ